MSALLESIMDVLTDPRVDPELELKLTHCLDRITDGLPYHGEPEESSKDGKLMTETAKVLVRDHNKRYNRAIQPSAI